MRSAAPEIIANFVAPYLVYEALDAPYGDSGALIASALPPLAWSAYELVKARRIDAVSALVAGSILLTVGATALGGPARMIQIRDALVTGAVGVAFLATLAARRPLIFHLARAAMARSPAGAAAYETLWDQPGVPALFRWLTLLWGLGLVCQTALLVTLAWLWPIPRYLLFSPPLSMASFAALMAASLARIARHPAGRLIFIKG